MESDRRQKGSEPVTRAAVVGELKGLAESSQGATLDRIKDMPTLMSLGREFDRRNPGQFVDVPQAVRELMRLAVQDLSRADLIGVVQGSLNLNQSPQVSKMGRWSAHPDLKPLKLSKSTLERREDEAWPQFAGRLLIYSGVTLPGASPQPADEPEPYIIDKIDARYRLAPGHLVQNVDMNVTITAVGDGRPIYQAKHAYFSEGTGDVLTLSPTFGCELVEEQVVDEYRYAKFAALSDLAVGEQYTFSYAVVLRPTKPVSPLVLVNASALIREQVVSIQFDATELAGPIWTFDKLPHGNARLAEHNRKKLERQEGRRVESFSFKDIPTGLCSGVTWEWRDSPVAPPAEEA